jgi:putative ABC transport system substrate-binding protein
MKRKTIVVVFLVALAVAPSHLAEAQQPGKVYRIGFLAGASGGASNLRGLRQGLRELGYIEGKNITIEHRFSEGKFDRFPALAGELVRLKVDVIVAGGGNASLAAKNATKNIPIVVASASDPVGAGLVASLARPGGNITGSTLINPDLSGKRLELLKEAIPRLSQVAVLVYRDNPAATLMLKETETAG